MSGREDDRRRLAEALDEAINRLYAPLSPERVRNVRRDAGERTGRMVAK